MKISTQKLFYMFLFTTFILTVMYGCGTDNSENSGNENNEETIELTYASGYPENHPQTGKLAEEWMENVNQATEGRVKFRGIHGGALLSAEDMVEGLDNQTADAGSLVISFWPGRFKATTTLSGVVDLEVGNEMDVEGVSKITEQMFDEFPEFEEEFEEENLTPLFWVPTPSYAIIATDNFSELSELKGKKIRPLSSNIASLLESADAVPVTVDGDEIYTGLQTNVIDGAVTDPGNMVSTNLSEVADHLIQFGPGNGGITAIAPVFFAINNDSFDQLSEEDQETVKQVSEEMIVEAAQKMEEEEKSALEQLEDDGVDIHVMSEEDIEKWEEMAPDWYDSMEKDLNDEGLPGTDISETYLDFVDDYIN